MISFGTWRPLERCSEARMVGDHPEAAPESGVKRKVMLPEAVLIKSAGSGLMGGTEGWAEMVTGSPSSPFVAMILRQRE